jgi:hypothetical protein
VSARAMKEMQVMKDFEYLRQDAGEATLTRRV